jgi:hypothetical protein
MAHKCRDCGAIHEVPDRPLTYPSPDILVRLAPLLGHLIEAAREFDSFGDGGAVEFIEWVAVDAKRASMFSPNTRWSDGLVIEREPRREKTG